MRLLTRLRSGCRTLFRRSTREAELDEEIRFHLESASERYLESGLPPDEARRRARLDFGGVDLAKEQVRERWALARLSEVAADARLALRGVRRRPMPRPSW